MTEDVRDIDTIEVTPEHAAALDWLQQEFPEWDFEIGTATTLHKETAWWVARREGHHPQSELTAGKLYSRLSDYVERERRRGGDPSDN